ncbi:peptidoglycan DD-metalloendopeptidase family protein [Psychrobacter jeotgali]|uniref:peptidoglycan DD-metalloendopeptidase family protein n=1 Tax=Psychrobacter jeotgali TaxID=179010 RepID=UPI001917BD0C|nr:peptidoglycan DD-metalloendopeptidase family protein [Psychrobacter jeotgali]
MKKFTFRTPLTTVAVVATMSVVMAGCATKPTYQPPNQAGPTIITNNQGVPNYYQVKRGDTVSEIAARYRLNYRQIGAMNNLDSKYTIYTGQYLKLWQGDQNLRASTNNQVRYNAAATAPSRAPQPQYTPPPTGSAPVYQGATNTAASGYQYPTRNQVVRNFDASSGTMGMWFAGNVGDPVLASQAGTVLYAGDGLPEYGNLIMIRHSGDYITAYAHNSQLLVKEGEQVQTGQRIANMGSSGQTNQVGLEFQVRLNGNPIDPRTVLGR